MGPFWAAGFWATDFWVDDFWLGMGDEGGDDGSGASAEWNVQRLQGKAPPVRISTRTRPVRFPNPRR